jgi:hypothetical protein
MYQEQNRDHLQLEGVEVWGRDKIKIPCTYLIYRLQQQQQHTSFTREILKNYVLLR